MEKAIKKECEKRKYRYGLALFSGAREVNACKAVLLELVHLLLEPEDLSNCGISRHLLFSYPYPCCELHGYHEARILNPPLATTMAHLPQFKRNIEVNLK